MATFLKFAEPKPKCLAALHRFPELPRHRPRAARRIPRSSSPTRRQSSHQPILIFRRECGRQTLVRACWPRRTLERKASDKIYVRAKEHRKKYRVTVLL